MIFHEHFLSLFNAFRIKFYAFHQPLIGLFLTACQPEMNMIVHIKLKQ